MKKKSFPRKIYFGRWPFYTYFNITFYIFYSRNIDVIKNLLICPTAPKRRRMLLLQHKGSQALMTDGGRNESQIYHITGTNRACVMTCSLWAMQVCVDLKNKYMDGFSFY